MRQNAKTSLDSVVVFCTEAHAIWSVRPGQPCRHHQVTGKVVLEDMELIVTAIKLMEALDPTGRPGRLDIDLTKTGRLSAGVLDRLRMLGGPNRHLPLQKGLIAKQSLRYGAAQQAASAAAGTSEARRHPRGDKPSRIGSRSGDRGGHMHDDHMDGPDPSRTATAADDAAQVGAREEGVAGSDLEDADAALDAEILALAGVAPPTQATAAHTPVDRPDRAAGSVTLMAVTWR